MNSVDYLPVIDYKDVNAAHEFAQSLHHTGFAVLKNYPINIKDIQNIYNVWYKFFQQSDAAKMQYAFSAENHDGFVSTMLSEKAKGNNIKDLKEFFHYYSWGQCPPELSEDTENLFKQMLSFASELLSWVEKFCPQEVQKNFSEPLSNMIVDSKRNLLRILHYPPITTEIEPGAIRAAAHGDINLLTVLPSANEPGLQVLSKDNTWVDVPYDSEYLVVNIGDMLEECCEGFYKSTQHRVVNPEGADVAKSRMSIPLFLHPRDEVILSSRYTAKQYCDQRYSELGLDKKDK